MEFGSYTANHVPRPVEYISKMMERLDENNRRVSTTYNNVSQALDSFDVAPVDRPIVDNIKDELTSNMAEVVDSGDYAMIEGKLNKSVRTIATNPALKASVLRYKEYNAKKDEVHDLYYKQGKLDKASYDWAMKQEYTATTPDNNGRYVNSYDNFITPPKAVDVIGKLTDYASAMPTDTVTGKPTFEYYTNAEYYQSLGQSTEGMATELLKQNSPHLKSIRQGGSTFKSASEINSFLKSILETDPDMKAYLEFQSDIGEKSVEDIIGDYVTPIATAMSSNVDRSTTQVSRLPTRRASTSSDSSDYDTRTNIHDESSDKRQEELIDDASPSWARRALSSIGNWVNESEPISSSDNRNFSLYNGLTKSLSYIGNVLNRSKLMESMPTISPDNKNYGLYNGIAKAKFNTPYNKLTGNQKEEFLKEVTIFAKEVFPKVLKNSQSLVPADPKIASKIGASVLGTNQKFIVNDGGLTNSFNDGTYYDFETGAALSKAEFIETLESRIPKDSKLEINYSGYSPFTELGEIYDAEELNRMHFYKIGGKTYGLSTPVGDNDPAIRFSNNLIHKLKNENGPGTVGKGRFRSYVTYDANTRDDNGRSLIKLASLETDIQSSGYDRIEVYKDYINKLYTNFGADQRINEDQEEVDNSEE